MQLYSDISAEWVSGDNSLGATWSTTTGNTIVHQVQLANQVVYSERNDHIQRRPDISFREELRTYLISFVSEGSAYYATSNVCVACLRYLGVTRITTTLSRLLAPRFRPAPT